MFHRKRVYARNLTIAVLGMAVASCGGGGGGMGGQEENPPSVVKQEDSFGAEFATAYRADENSEPANSADGDLSAESLTSEPININ